jgi:hypothetical protein
MGGAVGVESEGLGRGTKFVIALTAFAKVHPVDFPAE